jgi:hypothetical protein
MTTHDQHSEVPQSTQGHDSPDYPSPSTENQAATEQAATGLDQGQRTVPAGPRQEQGTVPAEQSMSRTDNTMTSEVPGTSTEPSGPSTGRELFADDELAGMRARWDNVQAGFVDDPRECVQKADSLVSDVVDRLTAGFAQARSRLEEQWARGEEASTEDLRVALKRYREFFERLLAV